MGMKEHPCSSYLIRALDLLPLLPEEHREQFEQLVCDCDTEDAAKLLDKCWPEDYPPFCEVFLLGDEDTGDENMERGETYVNFDEEDLFIKTPTIALENLKAAGQEPKLCNWSIYG